MDPGRYESGIRPSLKEPNTRLIHLPPCCLSIHSATIHPAPRFALRQDLRVWFGHKLLARHTPPSPMENLQRRRFCMYCNYYLLSISRFVV